MKSAIKSEQTTEDGLFFDIGPQLVPLEKIKEDFRIDFKLWPDDECDRDDHDDNETDSEFSVDMDIDDDDEDNDEEAWMDYDYDGGDDSDD